MNKIIYFAIIVLFALTSNSLTAYSEKTEKITSVNKRTHLKYKVKKGESISFILKKFQLPLFVFLDDNPIVRDRGNVNFGDHVFISVEMMGTVTNKLINKEIKKYVKLQSGRFVSIDSLGLLNSDVKSSDKIVTTGSSTKVNSYNIASKKAPVEINGVAGATSASMMTVGREDSTELNKKIILIDNGYAYHNVMPKETLGSIARVYNVSVSEIRNANNGITSKKIKPYSVLKIPVRSANPIVLDTVPNSVEMADFEIYANDDELNNIDIAMLMPIAMTENLDPRDDGFKDLFRGFLLAADSLKSLGLSSNIDLYGVGRDTDAVYGLIFSKKLENKDLIIGPVFNAQFSLTAKYAHGKNIAIVNPLLESTENLGNIIEIIPDKTNYWDKLDDIATDKKIIYYKSENDDEDFLKGFSEFISPITDTLVYDKMVSADTMSLSLDMVKENLIVVAAKDNFNIELLLSKLTALKSRAGKAKFKVICSSNASDIPKERRGDFFKIDLTYITSSYQDRSNQEALNFELKYFQRYSLPPSVFAYRGYELGLVLLKSYRIYGKDFMNKMDEEKYNVIQTPYFFYRENSTKKLINQEWLLVNYRSNYTVTVK